MNLDLTFRDHWEIFRLKLRVIFSPSCWGCERSANTDPQLEKYIYKHFLSPRSMYKLKVEHSEDGEIHSVSVGPVELSTDIKGRIKKIHGLGGHQRWEGRLSPWLDLRINLYLKQAEKLVAGKKTEAIKNQIAEVMADHAL